MCCRLDPVWESILCRSTIYVYMRESLRYQCLKCQHKRPRGHNGQITHGQDAFQPLQDYNSSKNWNFPITGEVGIHELHIETAYCH